ncbi:sensor histidine kinase [Anaerobacillus alkaliphilus]|uniref:Sensor histidine kinase n=1 Tax=Anaerobacillus alkaliphilus TaxID=1548597 RepID=A0A4Q0VVM1_9BACI|nr:sensor histidine kinase [Anaerobacillus alkaliphilus]RXJ02075.1 sensor histidine kinase [Anaerobacillus alkaliphilus]
MFSTKYRLNNIKLRNKLLILYISCVFLPIVLTNIAFYQVTMTNIKNQKMHDVQLVLDQVTSEFITTIDQAVGVATRFYTDSTVYDFFEKEYGTTIEYIDAYDVYLRNYNRFSPLYYSIQSITFYTDNPTVIFAGGVRPISEQTKETTWYNRVSNSKYPVVMRPNPTVESHLFSVFSELDYYITKRDMQKIIKIDINQLTVKRIFENISFPGNIYLLNEHGDIEFSNDMSIDWRTSIVNLDTLSFSNDTIFLEEKLLQTNYFKGWKVVGTITQQEILQELYNSRRFIFLLASITFIVPTLIIILISRSLHVRLSRVLRHMRKMKNQDFAIIKASDDLDEIGELTKEFNRMSRTINKLINEVYVAKIEKKDLELKEKQAQLSALQSQINPHFLFNALETIRMRSLMKDEKETAKIIQNMAKIFRNSLTWGKEWVTVREEMKLMICFLEIQKYRFGDKLEYEIEVDDDAYDCIIPNLAFLPFVENASIHGIEAVKDKGKIHVKIELIEGDIVYTLRDNGAGMTKEKLQQLINGLKNENSMGESVGIKNVYYRLKLYYKDSFDFTIDSEPNVGTTIIIKLKSEK